MPRTSRQLGGHVLSRSSVGEETNAAGDKGGSEDEVDEPPANVPNTASFQEATSGLEDVLHFLETKGNMKTANELAKVIELLLMYKVIGLSKDEASRNSQTFLKPFELCNNCESLF